MECLLQYLDDLDDLYGALGLVWERMRRSLAKLIYATLLAAVAAGAVWLALLQPPVAMAVATMLFVILLYRSVTAPVLNSFV
ncbi:MAG: hypothetical protein KJP17_04620 [Gammaproteobacteria bacterium]|nr:hypothetical protein [Gammaproteobacteria bacterium]